MIVTLTADAPDSTTAVLLASAGALGLDARVLRYADGNVVGIDGTLPTDLLDLPGVASVQATHKPYMLASNGHRATSIVRVGHVEIGRGSPVIMAGPCVVEGEAELIAAAQAVKSAGATILRGGAFKPRTSPYAFQGLGEDGLRHLARARDVTGLPVVTEVLEPEQVGMVAAYADMIQIGARNMQNYPLLRKAGSAGKPVLLKRGFSATVDEWLMAAEYILAHGNPDVVLCERGIRGFDPAVRFNLDLNAVPLAKELSHLPVIVDPSHGTGIRSLVRPMSLAAIAAGADGLIVEVHPDPARAKCDATQTIDPRELATISRQVAALSGALAQVSDAAEWMPEPELAMVTA